MAARDLAIEIVLIGDREMIAKELGTYRTQDLSLTIEHAGEAVAMDESPLESKLDKPDSSINVGLEMVKQGRADAFVSAGNSGAVMATAMAILGTLPGVDRPAIASLVPTSAGLALLIDAGANTEVKPINLVQFGVMGSVYWKHVHQAEHPRVAILSNGEEESKGTELTRSAAAMLAAMAPEINYIGYVEGRDINRAHADVVVTDGFTGNVALKTMEGFAAFMMGNLRELFATGVMRRFAYLLVRKRMSAMRARLDPSEYGGAPLMGVGGVAIIAHGSSNARAIRNAVRAAANEALVNQVNAEIAAILAKVPNASSPGKTAGKGIRGLFGRMRERLSRHREAGDRRPEAERGEGGRKTGPLAAPEHADSHNGTEVVLHPEAVLDPQVYGVNHRREAPNGVAKVPAAEPHEETSDLSTASGKNSPGQAGMPDHVDIKKLTGGAPDVKQS